MKNKLTATVIIIAVFFGTAVQPAYARNHRHSQTSLSSDNISVAEKRFAKLIYNDLSNVPHGTAAGSVLISADASYNEALTQAKIKLAGSISQQHWPRKAKE